MVIKLYVVFKVLPVHTIPGEEGERERARGGSCWLAGSAVQQKISTKPNQVYLTVVLCFYLVTLYIQISTVEMKKEQPTCENNSFCSDQAVMLLSISVQSKCLVKCSF